MTQIPRSDGRHARAWASVAARTSARDRMPENTAATVPRTSLAETHLYAASCADCQPVRSIAHPHTVRHPKVPSLPETSDLLAAALADRYRVERELGRGGMATVYLAHDLRHDRPVALKVLRPELAASLGPERFLREIRIAARLQHPHILAVHDSGEAAGRLWYTMPYVEGGSLRQRMLREGQLPLDQAVRIATQVLSALGYAHAQGVIHRDIKPENILLEGDEAVVADFGVARAISAAGEDRLTETGLALGTPAYMSPEQAGASRRAGRTERPVRARLRGVRDARGPAAVRGGHRPAAAGAPRDGSGAAASNRARHRAGGRGADRDARARQGTGRPLPHGRRVRPGAGDASRDGRRVPIDAPLHAPAPDGRAGGRGARARLGGLPLVAEAACHARPEPGGRRPVPRQEAPCRRSATCAKA